MFIVKVKIVFLIEWSYRVPLFMLIIALKWLAYFHHVIQYIFNSCVFVLRFTSTHTPLKYRCLFEVRNPIRHIYLILIRNMPNNLPNKEFFFLLKRYPFRLNSIVQTYHIITKELTKCFEVHLRLWKRPRPINCLQEIHNVITTYNKVTSSFLQLTISTLLGS